MLYFKSRQIAYLVLHVKFDRTDRRKNIRALAIIPEIFLWFDCKFLLFDVYYLTV